MNKNWKNLKKNYKTGIDDSKKPSFRTGSHHSRKKILNRIRKMLDKSTEKAAYDYWHNYNGYEGYNGDYKDFLKELESNPRAQELIEIWKDSEEIEDCDERERIATDTSIELFNLLNY